MAVPDVVVVGGGIIGAACADDLARRGMAVTLLERDELAAGASGRNQGLLVVPEDPALVGMARESYRGYLALDPWSAVPISLDPDPVGLILVGETDADLDQDRFDALPVPAERLEPEALRQVEPELAPDLAGGFLLHDGHRLNPTLLTVALAERARRHGAEIRHHAPVRALLGDSEGVRAVVTDDEVLETETVLLAAGPWSAALLRPIGIDLPVSGARGWLLRVDPTRPLLERLIEDAGRGFHLPSPPVTAASLEEGWPAAETGMLAHPAPDGSMILGSSREAAIADIPNDNSVPAAILRRTSRFLPALADAVVRSTWHGVRPISPDERPIVGRVTEGLVVATGHGSEGVSLAGGTAALVGTILAGEDPPFDPEPFSPLRFG